MPRKKVVPAPAPEITVTVTEATEADHAIPETPPTAPEVAAVEEEGYPVRTNIGGNTVVEQY